MKVILIVLIKRNNKIILISIRPTFLLAIIFILFISSMCAFGKSLGLALRNQ